VARTIRYQGAIIRDHHILLIQQTEYATGRSYWLFPGGGIEPDETEEACVQREMQEETNLRVQVQSLLLDELATPGGIYQRRKTYVCHVLEGDAQPGYEPEPEFAGTYGITAVGWFDLRHPAAWNDQVVQDPITYPQLQRIQAALGYTGAALDLGTSDP
jgi:8-oxo-dGTP pyrophosphatase MutT (NUDIX family)